MIRDRIVYTGTKTDLIEKYGFHYKGGLYKEAYVFKKETDLVGIEIKWSTRQLLLNGQSPKLIAKLLEMADELKYVQVDNIDEQIKAKEKELAELKAKKRKSNRNHYMVTYFQDRRPYKSHCVSPNPFVSQRIKLRLDCPYVYKCEIKDLRTGKIIYSGKSWKEIEKLGVKYVK